PPPQPPRNPIATTKNVEMAADEEGTPPTSRYNLLPKDQVAEKKLELGSGKGRSASHSFLSLFRYASSFDMLLTFVGLLCSGIMGSVFPVMSLLLGNITDDANQSAVRASTIGGIGGSPVENLQRTSTILLVVIGLVSFIAGYVQNMSFVIASENQARRIRTLYFEAILRAEQDWFDTAIRDAQADAEARKKDPNRNPWAGGRGGGRGRGPVEVAEPVDSSPTGAFTARLTSDVALIKDAIGAKLASIASSTVTVLVALAIAFSKGWQFALVLCGTGVPIIFIISFWMHRNIRKRVIAGMSNLRCVGGLLGRDPHRLLSAAQDAQADAGAIAQEVISSIRTVAAFGKEDREVERYGKKIQEAVKHGEQRSFVGGLGVGSIMLFTFCCGQATTVFVSSIMAVTSFGSFAPTLTSISTAVGAAQRIFGTIERKSAIDPLSHDGKSVIRDNVKGRIEFSGISFEYAGRKDISVLRDLSLVVEAGRMTAVVGASGSGKSTLTRLVLRLYDPTNGAVLLDGVPLTDLNVASLRSVISIVQQEPVLFSKSVLENVLMGLAESDRSLDKDEQEKLVKLALELANANFVFGLPEGWNTLVGERGIQLSGGENQRIAIARAIVSNPPILLLDEATSALDTRSERLVQAALDTASRDRTVLVIAHRLSTIKNADLIVVMQDGQIVERGTHKELIDLGGMYKSMVDRQDLRTLEHPHGNGDDQSHESTPATGKTSEGTVLELGTASSSDGHKTNGDVNSREKRIDSDEAQFTENKYMKKQAPWGRVARESTKEWVFIVGGAIGSLLTGFVWPLFSVILSQFLAVFGESRENIPSKSAFWSEMLILLGEIWCNSPSK
ncbi:ATP-binding cassette, sub-B (MDR TAP), member 4, partial [Gonapodya sp. JEL0774]